jgi:CBS domain-containing protein/ribosome-associated translation inhibitor RaiA
MEKSLSSQKNLLVIRMEKYSLDELKNLKVSELITKNFEIVQSEDLLAKAFSRFPNENRALAVFSKDWRGRQKFEGILTEKALIYSKLDPKKNKVKSLVQNIGSVKMQDNLLDVTKKMFASQSFLIPVLENSVLKGFVTDKTIMQKIMQSDFSQTKVSELQTLNLVFLKTNDSLGKAVALFREHGLSKAPVLDDSGRLRGILSFSDILKKAVYPKQKIKEQAIVPEKVKIFDNTVDKVMTEKVITIKEDDFLGNAINKMLSSNIKALVVLSGNRVKGILSRRDILEGLIKTVVEPDGINITLHGDAKKEINPKNVEAEVQQLKTKYPSLLSKSQIFVYLKRQKGHSHRNEHFSASIRMHTPVGLIVASTEGFGIHDAMSKLIQKAKRQLLSHKYEHKEKHDYLKEVEEDLLGEILD